MLEHAKLAMSFVGSADPEQLEADKQAFLAARKAIEIVGEAANQVSNGTRAMLPEIAWSDAIAMRHKLIHGYRSIRAEVVVGTVRSDFPPLIAALNSALGGST